MALTWDHNHSITSAHAISFRPIATETREQFYTYFEQGHSLSSSIHHHSFNIAIKYEGRELQYQTALADRSINPLPKDIYYLYHKWRSEKHGKENGETMFNQLTKIIEEYNKEHAQIGGRAFLQQYEHKSTDSPQKIAASQPLVLAVCTPLMSRAHQPVKQAGELVYCGSTSSLDRYNCPTFIMSTCTSGGGIPLGVVITSGESEEVITEAITFLKAILPTNAFYGRGAQGPEVCITDDCDAERAALKNTWPNTARLLCSFHYTCSAGGPGCGMLTME